MASLTLESLPVELVEEIVAWLDFHDHCALRLTGRSVSVKSTNAAFRNYFLSKKLELAEAPLEQFVGVTQPGRFGLWVQDLTLYAPAAPPTSEDACNGRVIASSPRLTELLAQGFRNIRDSSLHEENLSITLKVQGNGIKRNVAAQVFRIAMSALRSTGLPIRSLEAFAEGYSHRRGGFCSFPFNEIPEGLLGGSSADLSRLATTFQSCKKIGLSLAHYINKVDSESVREFNLVREEGFDLPPSYEEARENVRSLCDLLNMCTATLEELHLVWEYNSFYRTAGVNEELYFFHGVAASCQFPNLKKCTMQNLRIAEATLLAFFRQHTGLVHLDLQYIYVKGGFDGLFEHLSTAMSDLIYLRLRGLYSSTGTLYFLDEPPENRLRNPRGYPRPGIVRRGPDARRPVVTRATR
ncbi:hypothetical protein ABHI18_006804 [Aspergillus niger]